MPSTPDCLKLIGKAGREISRLALLEKVVADYNAGLSTREIAQRYGLGGHATEEGRRAIFAEYGWELVILWEKDINSMSEEGIAELLKS